MIINGNNIEELKKFDDNYFDSIVTDPPYEIGFMGSGSTGVACVLNDFEFVGIDLDKDYCEIARARIEGVKETQTKMF